MLISGLTVMIAMAGMFFAGSIVFQSFAVGTILVVGIAVLGSLTVLPAVLSKLGDNVEKGRVPLIGRMRHRNHGESRVWGWILDRVLRRPVVSLVVSGGMLLALAIPAVNMHTVNAGASGAAEGPRGREGLRPHPGRVPRRPAPRDRGRPGRRRHQARGPGRHQGDDRQGAGQPARCPSP